MITGNSWLNPKCEVRESVLHCKGVFARESLAKDERLAIFGGSVMLIDDVYTLPESVWNYAMQIEERFVFGNKSALRDDTDYFNHSCDPNSGFRGQIFLVAMRDIASGEEITFDYAMIISESVGSNLVFTMDCTCGSAACRKKFTENDWKRPDLRARYRNYFSEYIQQKINREGSLPLSPQVSNTPPLHADFRRATLGDSTRLCDLRIEFLSEVNGCHINNKDTIYQNIHAYLSRALDDGTFISWLCVVHGEIVGTSGISFYQLPPSHSNPTGSVGYIMNMYTRNEYRGKGIASRLFEKMLEEGKRKGVGKFILHATASGKSIYQKYGFSLSGDEMVLLC